MIDQSSSIKVIEGDQSTIKTTATGLTTTETTSSAPTKTTNPATGGTKTDSAKITAKTAYPTSNHIGSNAKTEEITLQQEEKIAIVVVIICVSSLVALVF